TSTDPMLGKTSIVIGAVPTTPVAGTAPLNVTVNTSGGGQVFWGTNGITATSSSPQTVVNALGRNVVFNTGSRAASAITLQGKNTITADPPVAGSHEITADSLIPSPDEMPPAPPSVLFRPVLNATPAMQVLQSDSTALTSTTMPAYTNLIIPVTS